MIYTSLELFEICIFVKVKTKLFTLKNNQCLSPVQMTKKVKNDDKFTWIN